MVQHTIIVFKPWLVLSCFDLVSAIIRLQHTTTESNEEKILAQNYQEVDNPRVLYVKNISQSLTMFIDIIHPKV
jgi:hypothetical protein